MKQQFHSHTRTQVQLFGRGILALSPLASLCIVQGAFVSCHTYINPEPLTFVFLFLSPVNMLLG